MPIKSEKQKRFIKEYLIDLNATQAAIRAGYSKKTAQEQSSRLLSNVMIQAAIQVAKKARAKKTGCTAEFVIKGLMKEATSKEKDASATSRVSALNSLGKHTGIFEKDNKQKANEIPDHTSEETLRRLAFMLRNKEENQGG